MLTAASAPPATRRTTRRSASTSRPWSSTSERPRPAAHHRRRRRLPRGHPQAGGSAAACSSPAPTAAFETAASLFDTKTGELVGSGPIQGVRVAWRNQREVLWRLRQGRAHGLQGRRSHAPEYEVRLSSADEEPDPRSSLRRRRRSLAWPRRVPPRRSWPADSDAPVDITADELEVAQHQLRLDLARQRPRRCRTTRACAPTS